MRKETFKPIDLIHLQDKAIGVVNHFDESDDPDRSPEYRKVALRNAKQVAQSLVQDFRYCLDTYTFSGSEPLGLEDARRELINQPEL